MRETRTSGSEGGGIGQPILPTPIKKSANPGGFSGSALNTYHYRYSRQCGEAPVTGHWMELAPSALARL